MSQNLSDIIAQEKELIVGDKKRYLNDWRYRAECDKRIDRNIYMRLSQEMKIYGYTLREIKEIVDFAKSREYGL